MTRSLWIALTLVGIAARSVEASSAEIKLDRDFLIGIAQNLAPVPFQKTGHYRGTANTFRLIGINAKDRQIVVGCRLEGEFNERAIVAGMRKKPAQPLVDESQGERWKKFRFDVKISVNIEPGPDGTPRFRFEVEEVKRQELEGLAGVLAKVMGKSFDRIVTEVADSKSGDINRKLNAEVVKKVSSFQNYGIFCGIDYNQTGLLVLFDVTRLRSEGIVGYVYPTPTPGTVPFYRFMSPRRGDHFYSTNGQEVDPRLYKSEGIACYLFPEPVAGAVPFYRLRRPREKFYATAADAEKARRQGLIYEGIAGYLFPAPEPETVPLYRFIDPHSSLHFYTTHPHAEFAK